MTTHVLAGLRPQPLSSYLAGLGLVRLLGEQVDPAVTAAWRDDQLVVNTEVTDLAGWLVTGYRPTPVLSPWNEGSGFGTKDVTPRQKLDDLIAMPSQRLEPFRRTYDIAARVGERFRTLDGKKDEAKARAVREFRNQCPEELLPWIDATVLLGTDQVLFPPLLGTGGNDGRLDFSTTFHQRLLEVLDPAAKRRARSLTQARDLLAGTQEAQLLGAAIGQFDPAGAGGKGSSPFGVADSLVNPWGFVLLVEGALLFAASAARRHLHSARRAAIPFTVHDTPDGSASGADGEASRGEVWAPVWDRPYSYPEIRQLFAEARASWRGRPAQRAADFYAATRTLGVARGVAGFQRYGLHQRNGLSFTAVPIERVQVADRSAVRLAGDLEDWVSWVRRGESSTAVGRAVRRFDAAHFQFVRSGATTDLVTLLATLTDLELSAGRSGRAREAVPVRKPPYAEPFLQELASEACPELRVAVGLASSATMPGPRAASGRSRNLRQLLLPVDPDGRWRRAPVVPGYGIRELPQVLADVLVWRSRTAADEPDETSFRGVPTFRSGIPVPAPDLHAFAAGRLDPQLLDRLLRACLALRWDGVKPEWEQAEAPTVPVPTLALLHPLAAGVAPAGTGSGTARLALGPDWAVRLAAGQVCSVHTDAARRLRQAGWQATPAPPVADVRGAAVAAALLPRCRDHGRKMLHRVAIPFHRAESSPSDPAEASQPTNDPAEEMS